ncbi:MAG TPA: MBL fold metallo-hydrolase [Candidatus Limnocylindria bacterium]|nr:MBL fold metallo-hydrolase [Candidatus Limnocylindria bacterium]
MNVVPFVHEGLGNSSYLVELGGQEALLVDPDRSAQRYLRAAQDRGLRISAVLETHLHADFVSGARELAASVGAELYLPAGAEARFAHRPLATREQVSVGAITVEAVPSPGHTPEHLSYALRPGGEAPLLFSGGSLIVGGAARTDLLGPHLTEQLTRLQFQTLHNAFSALPDATLLYPTHGAGSFCSVGSSGERTSTLGAERAGNPLLALEDADAFVRWFPSTFPAAPDYFYRLRAVNQAGAPLRSELPAPRPLDAEAFDHLRAEALVVDTRSVSEYAKAHIHGALSNPFRPAYAVWLGWLVPPEIPLLFVLGEVPLGAVVDESLLVGHERLIGWLDGGMHAWRENGFPVGSSALVDAPTARRTLIDGAIAIDVREPNEHATGHIEGALHLPLGELAERVEEVPRDRPLVVYCGHGERAASAVSLLEARGFSPLLNLKGGMTAWRKERYKLAKRES